MIILVYIHAGGHISAHHLIRGQYQALPIDWLQKLSLLRSLFLLNSVTDHEQFLQSLLRVEFKAHFGNGGVHRLSIFINVEVFFLPIQTKDESCYISINQIVN